MPLWRRLDPVKLKFSQLKCFLDFYFFFRFSAAVEQRWTKEIQNVGQDYFTVLQRQWRESRGKSLRSDVTNSSLTLLGRVVFKLETITSAAEITSATLQHSHAHTQLRQPRVTWCIRPFKLPLYHKCTVCCGTIKHRFYSVWKLSGFCHHTCGGLQGFFSPLAKKQT